MSMSISLQQRLALMTVALSGVILGVYGSRSFWGTQGFFLRATDNDIETTFGYIAENINLFTKTSPFDSTKLTLLQNFENAGILLTISDSGGNLIVDTTPGERLNNEFQKKISTHIIKGQFFRVGSKHVGPYDIYLAKNIDTFVRGQQSALRTFILGGIFLLIVVYGLSSLIAKSFLQPLIKLTDHIRKYNINTPTLPATRKEKLPSEIGFVRDTFDDFTKTIFQFIQREKEFFQDTSHELRTPLSVLKNTIELLEQQPIPEHLQKKISHLHIATDKMTNLVNEILYFYKLDHEHISPEKVSIQSAIHDLTRLYLPLSEEYNCTITTEIKKNFFVDSTLLHIEKLLGNIIKNAIIYNKSGGTVTITIDAPTITITDTGIGISDSEREKIRQRFHRSHGGNAGIGLGLNIAKKILDLYGRKIAISSVVGEGTSFVIEMKENSK